MSVEEWESLCDRCGWCCLQKFEDTEIGCVGYTCVACRHLDIETCSCMVYDHRHQEVSNCLDLTCDQVPRLFWLPPHCAYRLIGEGKDLPSWHPLVTGDPHSVVEAGFSMRDRAITESDVPPEQLLLYIIEWIPAAPRSNR